MRKPTEQEWVAHAEKHEFTWNHRLVNVPSENGGEQWITVQEVHYENGKPTGYGEPCYGSETLEGAKQVCAWFAEAASKPVLHEDDFRGRSWSSNKQGEVNE